MLQMIYSATIHFRRCDSFGVMVKLNGIRYELNYLWGERELVMASNHSHDASKFCSCKFVILPPISKSPVTAGKLKTVQVFRPNVSQRTISSNDRNITVSI